MLKKMTLAELIKSTAWLSTETVFLRLYPDKEEFIDEYQNVFNQLQIMPPIPSNVTIIVEWVHDTYDDTHYVDVSGYYTNPADRTDEYTNSLAIEFTPWEEWLGMNIDNSSLRNFSELEIIAHCLNEMTFAGFEQQSIQAEMDRIKSIKEEFDNLIPEEKQKRTISLDELITKYDLDSDDEIEKSKED